MNTRINILHLLNARPNVFCGVEKNLVYFLEQSEKGQFENIIVYPEDGYLKKYFLSSGLQWYPLKITHKLNLSKLIFLKRVVDKHQINFIHTYSYNLDFTGYLLNLITNKPQIIGRPVDLSWCYYWGKFKSKVYKAVDKKVLHKAAKVIVCSQIGKTRLVEDYGLPEDKMEIIYNGVDFKKYENLLGINDNAKASSDEKVIAIVGQLTEYKGHQCLFYAFQRLAERYKRLKLLVVGDGVLMADLKKLAEELNIKDKINFTGTREDIPAVLAACDIFVLPSLREGIPLAMLEAMAAGKPVIVTPVGGIPEIIKDGENGLLVPPGNIEKLTEAIESLLVDQNKARNFAEKARKLVRDNYTIDKMVKAQQQLYWQIWEQKLQK